MSIADAFKRMQAKGSNPQPTVSKPTVSKRPKEETKKTLEVKKQISAADFFGVEPVKRVDKKAVKRKVVRVVQINSKILHHLKFTICLFKIYGYCCYILLTDVYAYFQGLKSF